MLEHLELECIALPSPESLNFHLFQLPTLRELSFYNQKSLPSIYSCEPLAEKTFRKMILSQLDLIDNPPKPFDRELDDNRHPLIMALVILSLALFILGIWRNPSGMFEGL
jgi:hypothetical protein